MIKLLSNNDTFKVITLMNNYVDTGQNHIGLNRNEAAWIEFYLNILKEQNINNPHYFAAGDFEKDELRGFLLASTYSSHYNHEVIMDVKDCIVDLNYNTTYTVIRLFNSLMEHIKKYKGVRWRADSIRAEEHTKKYANLLKLKYNAEIYFSAHGKIGD
jgi:predicted RecB family nuclease|tara:strand:- start:502 stop:975 length:474 start_codon:yes stop_codon:yes gene_type:complete